MSEKEAATEPMLPDSGAMEVFLAVSWWPICFIPEVKEQRAASSHCEVFCEPARRWILATPSNLEQHRDICMITGQVSRL